MQVGVIGRAHPSSPFERVGPEQRPSEASVPTLSTIQTRRLLPPSTNKQSAGMIFSFPAHCYSGKCSTHLTERKQNTQEESRGLVQRLFQGFVQVHIKLAAVHPHIVAAPVEQDSFQEDPDLVRLQVRDEDLGASVRGVGRPFGRLGEGDELRPVRQGREDFESFGQRTGLVA